MDIINKIVELRRQRGVTQSLMAERLGIAPNNYGKIEKGKTELTVSRLEQIAKVLGVSIGEFLTEYSEEIVHNDEVNGLKKRNEELEDRIKDKEKIIDSISEKLEKINLIANNHIVSKVRDYGLSKNIGTVICKNNRTGEEFSISSKDYWDSDLIFDFVKPKQKPDENKNSNRWLDMKADEVLRTHNGTTKKAEIEIKDIVFNEDEKKAVIQMVSEDYDFINAFLPFIMLGLVRDEAISGVFKSKYFPERPFII